MSLIEKLKNVRRAFSPAELVAFYILAALLFGSTLLMLNKINQFILVEVPARGGEITEGVIGSPRFINPLLAISDADRDLTTLVYSGLLKQDPNGELTPDLAESYTISEDGLTYTFILREDAYFHDGSTVSAHDVAFTVGKAQDPALKSNKRANWDGVTVEIVDDRTVRFILKQPYAPFLQNTTLGILPEQIWKNADSEEFAFSQFNIEPIGSGPYKVERIKRDSSGIPEAYELVPFSRYTLGHPYIGTISLRFYSNEDALIEAYRRGEVNSINSVSPHAVAPLEKMGARIEQAALPRIFGVFLNQNKAPVFAHAEVRQALNLALNKNRVVEDILGGYGTAINSPIPPGLMETDTETEGNREAAAALLSENGWEKNEEGIWEKDNEALAFSISTANAPELKEAATLIKSQWESFGAAVEVKVFETGDLNQNVIRPREYDSLLFGEIVGRELDLFAFWHSSQRNDPGLNIALYANITADQVLEDARKTSDTEEQLELYRTFEEEIHNDMPAVFLYAPDFIYIVPGSLRGLELGAITTPGERFLNVHEWYVQTDSVWSFFADN